jgi:polyribonucleotide nucleotidyltransferase
MPSESVSGRRAHCPRCGAAVAWGGNPNRPFCSLTCRLIDRSIRPLFADGLRCETQVIATVLSADRENDPDVVAMLGASAALHVSDIPFDGPLAGVRIGRIDGKWVINPTQSQLQESDTDIFLSGSKDAIVMVEGSATMVPEDEILEALFAGHEAIQPLLEIQEQLRRELGKVKRQVPLAELDAGVVRRVDELAVAKLQQAIEIPEKLDRYKRLAEVKSEVVTQAAAEFPGKEKQIKAAFDELKRKCFRGLVIQRERRIDGRGLKDIRPITCEVEVLPRTHGSALFTRGETQALVVATLGTASDEQRVDALLGEHYKKFMLHYNFPPFSVGEAKFLLGPGRREIGHGNLAERALVPVLPSEDSFPYTIRIVSEILESNGSTSMATVCGGSLALMDAGVPVLAPVAGIAMGLIKEGEHVRVLSDILGDEDHLGDMDFKVAGTEQGITSLQMDIKIAGITEEIMKVALNQAKGGRLHILGEMAKALDTARAELGEHAPRIESFKIPTDKIREVIGTGGKVIREIVEKTGAKINVEDDGTVKVASADGESIRAAVNWIKSIASDPEIGHIYEGTVVKTMDFGAFVNFFGAKDGLVHISQLASNRVQKTTDVVKEGDKVKVKLLGFDERGKVRLSMKVVDQATGEDLEAKQKAEGEQQRQDAAVGGE